MFSHITIGTNDLERSKAFYDSFLTLLGSNVTYSDTGYVQFGPSDGRFPHFFIYEPIDGKPATWGNGFEVVFTAASEEVLKKAASLLESLGATLTKTATKVSFDDPTGNHVVVELGDQNVSQGGPMFSKACLGSVDLERDAAFFTSVLSTLEIQRTTFDAKKGYADFDAGEGSKATFRLQVPTSDRPASWGNGNHIAFWARTRDQVDAFFENAMNAGATDMGGPGLRPNYSPYYYAAYVLDQSGNKIQAVSRERL